MRYLITGGEGFIGRNIKLQLESAEQEVFSLDVFGNPDYKVDILDQNHLYEALENIDGVFHLAAITSPPQFEEDLFRGFDVNVRGTLNVLKMASEAGVKRVVLASSSSVYGNLNVPGKEDMVIPGHENMYSTTKLFDEYMGKYFTIRGELEVVAMRFFNTYGLGENSKGMYSSVMTKFLDSIKNGKMPIIYGDGSQSRDFIHIDDVAQANIRAMTYGIPGEVYNVGTGVTTSFIQILQIITKILGREIKAEYISNPFKNYQFFTQANTDKTSQELNWSAKITLEDGIRRMIEGFRLL